MLGYCGLFLADTAGFFREESRHLEQLLHDRTEMSTRGPRFLHFFENPANCRDRRLDRPH